ncbi:hypothetical protein SKAU_G00031590 [Synaphobranchus kaupii]|uniref:Uncharacterized protein n=1 Tax=Synaphobranchus kaupii TaxID=118154 RepID=A0A9Q1GDR2_SYNKA|nr:hypothetical protein SKAU_G00031590 [Synaphobranchus kaupii]
MPSQYIKQLSAFCQGDGLPSQAMLFWIILGVLLCLDLSLAYEEVCYGKHFILRTYINRQHSVVSFTPSSPPGPTRIIVQNETLQDPRYELRYGSIVAQEVTERDEGTFTISVGRIPFVMERSTLKVIDCSSGQNLNCGEDFRFELSNSAAALYFSRKRSPSQFVTLWNKTHPTESNGKRGRVRGRYWLVDKVSYADRGYYTQRNTEGRFISRHHLNIQAKRDTFLTPQGDTLTFPLKIPLSQVQLYFTPAGDSDRQQLMKNGVLFDEYDSDTNRLIVEESWVEIVGVRASDSGIYEIEDPDGNLVFYAEVKVEESAVASSDPHPQHSRDAFDGPSYLKYLPLLGLFIAAVILCVCVKRICCKKSARAPIPAQPVMHGEVSSSTYPLNPSVPSQPQWSRMQIKVPSQPESTWKPNPSTSGYAYLMDSVPRPSPATQRASSHVTQEAEREEATAPSFPISSDALHSSVAGIQFDIGKSRKTGGYFSTLPLNMDTTEASCVYTSDKLNFP